MPGYPEIKEYVTSLRVYNSRSIALTFFWSLGVSNIGWLQKKPLRSSHEVQRETPSKWNLPMIRSFYMGGRARSLVCFIRERS
jgi:hypothetical protein